MAVVELARTATRADRAGSVSVLASGRMFWAVILRAFGARGNTRTNRRRGALFAASHASWLIHGACCRWAFIAKSPRESVPDCRVMSTWSLVARDGASTKFADCVEPPDS